MSSPEELERKAKKSTKGLFQYIFGSGDDDAQDLFNQAANLYKQRKQCESQGIGANCGYI